MLKSSIKTSKTSIIITTFNDAEYLKRSLPSVINQTLKPLEIIIIDDGSDNDDAKLIINSFKSITDIPLVFKKKSNGGPSSARNVGIKLAKGEFILFLDADDELLKNSLEWREEILESLDQNYASIYCSKIKLIDNKRKIKEKILETDGKLNVCLVGRDNGIPGQITHHLFRRDIVNEVNGYNESLKFNEDFEFLLRIAKKGLFFGVNRVGFIQHMRDDSWSNSDPYHAYNGVENFLNLASNKKLLPQIEIKLRRKENRLSLAKKVILFQRSKLKEVIPYIDEAFDIIKPQNIKEHTLFYLNKILKKL